MSNTTRALAYIEELWPRLGRSGQTDVGTLIGLPRPYLIPREADPTGGMFQEMYYWDSFFISLGLADTPHAQLIADVAENFAALIERFGVIPNGTRYYFLSRSQPPLFTEQIKLALAVAPPTSEVASPAWLARMLDLAEREHETVWLGTAQPHHRLVHRGLSRYFDINYLDVLASCESGWDHSTRCDDRWLEHLPVDLNCILYARERDMADFAETLGQPERAARWRARAAARQATLVALMWDEAEAFFFDYDYAAGRINPHASLAGFYPLWAGLASAEQAERVVAIWLPRFQQPGGLVTTLTEQAGRQWAWPNGWAPLQWLVAAGLDRYGYRAEAREARRRWSETCLNAFERTGAFWEKYNVVAPQASTEEGLYGQLHGFGWTNGVLVDFLRQGI
ncbi:MAG: trehalase family glycosidase [Thermoflexales bacterium]